MRRDVGYPGRARAPRELLLIAGVAGAFVAGAVVDRLSQPSSKDREKQVAAAFKRGHDVLADKLLHDKDLVKEIDSLRALKPENLAELSGNELFESAVKVQSAIFGISSDLKLSNEVVFGALVSEEVQATYAAHHVIFTYNPEDRLSPDSFNAHGTTNEDGTIHQAFIPLVPPAPSVPYAGIDTVLLGS